MKQNTKWTLNENYRKINIGKKNTKTKTHTKKMNKNKQELKLITSTLPPFSLLNKYQSIM